MSGASLAGTAPTGLVRAAGNVRAGRLAVAARVMAAGLALFALAAAARLWALDAYVTIDESRWVQRASDFAALIGQGNHEDTFIIGHPGVTTMWTALVGLGPERAHRFSFLEGRADATRRDGYFEALVAARRPFALIGALGVAAAALLGWRLLGAGPAVVGGALLAFEPFLVAHARVVHLDSGLTAYTAVAVLSGLVFWLGRGGWPFLVLSGLATGLAFLTKAPSVFVVGFVPLAAGLTWLGGPDRRPRGLLVLALQFGGWGLLAAAVAALLWPAFRVDPLGTLLKMAQFTERVGGGEHDNFFLGRVTDDPGPLFYPLALLLRLAPATLVGVLALVVLWQRLDPARRGAALWLAACGVGFVAMMTLGPKKFDRYVLPVFPLLGLLGGLGLWTLAGALLPRARTGLLAALVLAQLVTFLPVSRYPLAFYDPLLGGGALAERVLLVGWGEGLDQVAAWLNEQPRSLGEPTVATSYHRVLQAQLQGSALPLERVRMADYVVPYVNTLQRGAEAEVLTPYLASGELLHVVQLNGVEYARVYRGPHHPHGAAVGAELGGLVTLLQYTMAPGGGDLRPGEEVLTLLRWDRLAGHGERAVVAVLAPDGRVVVQDERPLGDDGPDEHGQPGETHRLTLPARTPPGTYWLAARALGRGGAALPVTAGGRLGDDWVILRDLQVGTGP